MSKSASFWAANSSGVKSPAVSAPIVTGSLDLNVPPMNDKAALEHTAYGVEKAHWADSDTEDDLVLSSIATSRESTPNPPMGVQKRNDRISELEATMKEQQRRFAELEGNSAVLATEVKKLKQETHKHVLQLRELVLELEKKDLRIDTLETEIGEQCAMIAEFTMDDTSPNASAHHASASERESELDRAMPPKADSTLAAKDRMVQNSTHDQFTDSTQPDPKTTIVPAGPTPNLSDHPIFATTATIKTAPLPPLASKLKMGVDLSKFGYDRVKKQPSSDGKAVDGAKNRMPKYGPAPKIEPSKDIRTMRLDERVLFGNGPKVQVKLGDQVLSTVPKYVLMQCSAKAYKHFSELLKESSFTLPVGSVDSNAAIAHLEWMRDMTFQNRVYSLVLVPDEHLDDKNLHICRAARVLGLNNKYVGHFTKFFCDRIRANAAPPGFLSKVATLAYPENDPIYDCLANNLANLRMREASKEPAELKALLEKQSALKDRVETIEQRLRLKQGETKR